MSNSRGRFGGTNGQREEDRASLLDLYRTSIQPMAVDIATIMATQESDGKDRIRISKDVEKNTERLEKIEGKIARYLGGAAVLLFIFNLITSGVINVSWPAVVKPATAVVAQIVSVLGGIGL